MITFSQSKYIIPYTGFITLPVGDGYLILSKDDYEDILYVAHIATEMELIDRFGEPCKALLDFLPHSLDVLAYLPSLLSFEVDELTLEQLIGCCAIILVNKRFSAIIELSADDFSALRFSEYILKEYQIPWRQFLDTCILSDEYGKPVDSFPSKYVFLSLYPGQGPIPGMIGQNSHAPPAPMPLTTPAPVKPRSEWEEFAENPDMVYIGSGAFMHRITFNMKEISDYNDTIDKLIRKRLKELGRASDDEDDTDNHSTSPVVSQPSQPTPQVTNPPEEADQIRRALFNRQGV